MLQSLIQHFEYLHHFNLHIIHVIEQNDIDSEEINFQVSKLLNLQHIEVCKLLQIKCESEEFDIHTSRFWEQLERANFQSWSEFFLAVDLENYKPNDLNVKLLMAIGKNHESIGVLKQLLKNFGINLEDQTVFLLK